MFRLDSLTKHRMKVHAWNYVMILPGVVLLFLFAYLPMMGMVVAFKDYRIVVGMWESPWVGFANFYFLQDPHFWQTVKNTLYITIYRMAFGFFSPILLALMLNEVVNPYFKRTIQSVSYLPHFISWIVVAYMLHTMLALDTGVINALLKALGFDQINFLSKPEYFRGIVVASAIWKEAGWGAILYLAALSDVDPQLHEAAKMDGAGRLQRIRHIDIPGIMPTIVILFVLQMPGLLVAGYHQIYPLVNPANLPVSEVLDVYIIRLGLNQAQYDVATAIGLLLSFGQLILILAVNRLANRLGHEGVW